ncbi:hypothetical protein [Desulfogranum mediterraneum]|uniref:hypothetical protein n=1 Tax=Desulfogranum mediterraneum TaxID=160661 RepID=UPI00048E4355|nr:hypothetical protein [Desulfogranum mediterraneum]
MLNELYSMYQGLEAIGEVPPTRHNDIQSPGMGTTFRVILNSDGRAKTIELLNREKIKDTWSIGNGNKNYFPAVKLSYPLFPDAHAPYQRWKKDRNRFDAKAYRQVIAELTAQYSVDHSGQKAWPGYRPKIAERQKQLADLQGGAAHCVYELFSRYLHSETGLSILDDVANLLISYANSSVGKEGLKKVCDGLFADGIYSNGRVKDNVKVTLLLDFMPRNDLNIGATSRDWVPYISDALSAHEKSSKKAVGNCSITGQLSQLVKNKFPSEKLNVVGSTILFAKNSGTSGPTVQRYGKSGTEAFLASEELCQELAATISKLTNDELQWKTWVKISTASGSSPSLLLAYCMDDISVNLTVAFSGHMDVVDDIQDYEKATARLLKLIKGKSLSSDAVVTIAEVSVVDKANRKINYAKLTTVKKLEKAAHDWTNGLNNRPHFYFMVLIDGKRTGVSHWSIAPQRVVDISRLKFIRDGSESTHVPGLSFAECMVLFLSSSKKEEIFARRCIVRIIRQYQKIFQHVVLAKHHSRLGKNAIVKANYKRNTQALEGLCLLSVLLYKAGRLKEVFMKEGAFQLGQLCAAMDELHIGYCQSVRGGQVPNTLLGSQTYGVALHDPIKAMGLLATRLKPYESWAIKQLKTRKPGGGDDKAIQSGIFAYLWLKRQAAEFNAQLENLQKIPTDYYKAELMLGYLAGRPFEGKKADPTKTDPQGDKG